ncbi:hypothetical protein ACPA54_24285 [Uniformispora flossi]|uniref:hypothetical protein n=1 Tax=Uniformispora flossi TaxID=3390723 RepID=UPI003C2D5193
MAAVGFIVAMVLFGVIAVVNGGVPGADDGGTADDGVPSAAAGDDQATDSAALPAATPTSAPPLPSAAPAAPCPALDAKDRTVPTLAPDGVTWSLYHQSLLPMSATAGPARADGDAVRCFAHTPVGALLAAAQVTTRYSFSDDWQLVMDRSLAPGPERDAARTARTAAEAAASASPRANTGTGGTVMQLAGFKFVSYTEDTAVIQMMRATDGGLHMSSALYTIKWVEGDWRLQLQTGGKPAAMVQEESSLSGFVPWQAGGS